jgi:regulatory protein
LEDPISKKEAKLKAARYCAYQERTQQEVREKLFSVHADHDEAEEIISELISENFINEERFARTFASGRFRLKKWGRNRIRMELEKRGLTPYCVISGLEEIPEEDYLEMIRNLVSKKIQQLPGENIFQKKDKTSRFLIKKGFEPHLIWEVLDELYPR